MFYKCQSKFNINNKTTGHAAGSTFMTLNFHTEQTTRCRSFCSSSFNFLLPWIRIVSPRENKNRIMDKKVQFYHSAGKISHAWTPNWVTLCSRRKSHTQQPFTISRYPSNKGERTASEHLLVLFFFVEAQWKQHGSIKKKKKDKGGWYTQHSLFVW